MTQETADAYIEAIIAVAALSLEADPRTHGIPREELRRLIELEATRHVLDIITMDYVRATDTLPRH